MTLDSMGCFNEGKTGLLIPEQQYFSSLTEEQGEAVAVELAAMMERTDSSSEYWKLANCLKALSLLGPAAAAAGQVLKSPKYMKDPRDPVRFGVLRVFAAMGPAAAFAIEELRDAQGDSYSAVSNYAKKALRAVGAEISPTAFDPSWPPDGR